ncbi:hypothetical protein [Paenibacillus roseipurpureus]|uniref:Uncharacterized protein n=1 Tax=Paenibacillus roseopurpureus TaxID=2918901 RepID=A0AA96LKD8_9BACL|nr:hypothetical protein [Paenibacillus sp. MBLB1832]WNR43365.1 hypothetical protein MJB10_19950 [Paenibacillus sp. MBLB1832]
MKVISKWTKWQIGFVILLVVVYLFQEVKDSPQFLKAVREAAASKLTNTPKVASAMTESVPRVRPMTNGSEKIERRGSSRDSLNSSSGTVSPTQSHTRSHAS